jgi:anti-sigma-K factor RskA
MTNPVLLHWHALPFWAKITAACAAVCVLMCLEAYDSERRGE